MTTNVTNYDRLFPGQVRARREMLQISQQVLSDKLKGQGIEISQHAVAQIELGKRGVKIGEAYGIAGALDTTLDQLTTGPVYTDGESRDVTALLDLALQLDQLVELETLTRLAISRLHVAVAPYLDRLEGADVEQMPLPAESLARYKQQASRLRAWQNDHRSALESELSAKRVELQASSTDRLRDLERFANGFVVSPFVARHINRADQLITDTTRASKTGGK